MATARNRGAAAVLAVSACAALGACGATRSTRPPAPAAATLAPRIAAAPHRSASRPPAPAGALGASAPERRIARTVAVAQATYRDEVAGGKLAQQLERVARDGTLLAALARGDLAGAQAEAHAQLLSTANHLDHVTRIAVVRGTQEVVNATINANGVFVVAPGRRVLRARGRTVGTLWVSIQDVVGYAKLVHNLTGAAVVVRGASGQVRTSPGAGAAAGVPLPRRGGVTIAGRAYGVRSFGEAGWGGEALTVWVLQPA